MDIYIYVYIYTYIQYTSTYKQLVVSALQQNLSKNKTLQQVDWLLWHDSWELADFTVGVDNRMCKIIDVKVSSVKMFL